MTASAAARPGLIARSILALAAIVTLTSCGGGAVSGPPSTGGATLAISPATGTLYAESPFTFIITGGTGTYIVTSTNQIAVPIVGLAGSELTVVPGPVSADTPVTIEVRDTGTATPVSAIVTVKPRSVSNVVTVTPSASQSTVCGTAVCAGGDAEVKVQLTQTGLPLANRSVRFDVVSGDFRIITSAPGAPEVLSLTGTTNSDASGVASMRVRVLNDAFSQTALLQVTDISTGFTQRASFTIAPSSNAPLNAQPSTINFQGVAAETCASNISADVIVFGGRPPYQISQPGSFTVTPSVVATSGGRFTIRAIGQCSPGSAIAIVDSNGATVTVTATNALSDVTPPTPTDPDPPSFRASTRNVVLSSCSAVANVTLSGGSGNYFATSGDSRIKVVVSGNLGSISAGTDADNTIGPVVVTFSDGEDTTTVSVDVAALPPAGC